MNKLNPFQICEIKVFADKKDPWYVWKREKRFLGLRIRKSGYYWTFSYKGHQLETITEIQKNGTRECRGLNVFYKPHIQVFMSDGLPRKYYFDSTHDMYGYLNQPTLKGIKWINVPPDQPQ